MHQLFTGARIVVVAGKGGVGKTTVSAAMARAAARSGLRVLLVDLQGSPALAAMVGQDEPFGYEPRTVDPEVPGGDHGAATPPGAPPAMAAPAAAPAAGALTVRRLDPGVALAEYLDQHGLRRVSKRLVTTGVVDVVATAAPGIDDLLVLGKLKQIERSGEFDLVVVDGPPAGHAITFLLAAASLRDAVGGGPIAAQADDVLELLADPQRCRVVLVTVPETTPVNELVETAEALRSRAGVHLGPVVVNGVDAGPRLRSGRGVPRAVAAAARFRNGRRARHAAELARLDELLPGPRIQLPLLPATHVGATESRRLATELLAAVTPP